jgi:hypothetical protein
LGVPGAPLVRKERQVGLIAGGDADVIGIRNSEGVQIDGANADEDE